MDQRWNLNKYGPFIGENTFGKYIENKKRV